MRYPGLWRFKLKGRPMTIRILTGAALVLALAQPATSWQGNGKGNGNKSECVSPTVRWDFDNGSFVNAVGEVPYRITSDGGSYEGPTYFCGGKEDAHMDLPRGSKRWVNFDFSELVTQNPDGSLSADKREVWMSSTGPVPIEWVHLNVRKLGQIRDKEDPSKRVSWRAVFRVSTRRATS
jgi:hypothetical protein